MVYWLGCLTYVPKGHVFEHGKPLLAMKDFDCQPYLMIFCEDKLPGFVTLIVNFDCLQMLPLRNFGYETVLYPPKLKLLGRG